MNRWQDAVLAVLLWFLLAFSCIWIFWQFADAYQTGLLSSVFNPHYPYMR